MPVESTISFSINDTSSPGAWLFIAEKKVLDDEDADFRLG